MFNKKEMEETGVGEEQQEEEWKEMKVGKERRRLRKEEGETILFLAGQLIKLISNIYYVNIVTLFTEHFFPIFPAY